ncbi:MAG: alpha-glucosidase [Spirochaetes bacterium]|nr:MAG: alpha-glucosidase [Spirochaetota bacterium]RKX88945.1 MAG: alpha-glucosidase [Spirochaetota bacterium]RKX98882.1 MAG: alpha-glucosidase [Spirochaetota bacterium]
MEVRHLKIALFGAGSAQFGIGTLGDIFQSSVLKGAEVSLMDVNGEALEKVSRTALEYLETHRLDFTITATTKRKEALKGADFVIISIEVGDRFALWDMDWKVPMQYGIPQVYGENGGPGGIFHALRITPPILEICDDIVDICPDAVVFNYSNPMTAITTAVLRKHPKLRFVGLCHEIASLKRYLPEILNIDLKNIRMRAAGLNHFSVLLEAAYIETGKDAYPDILEKAPAFFEREPGFSELWDYTRRTGVVPETEGALEKWKIDIRESFRPWSDRSLFRAIMETYRLLPITLDSHLGEYISWAQDVADHQGILDFYEFYRHALSNQTWSEITDNLRERVVPIMEGIINDSGYEEMAVNVLNNGAIPDFPDGIAVELPATVDHRGVTGVRFDSYPKGFGALIRNYAGVYDLTVDAILTGSRDLVIQAVLACPVVNKYHGMREMVDTMLDNQRKWLDYIS